MPKGQLWTESGKIAAQIADALPDRPRIIPNFPRRDMTRAHELDKVRALPRSELKDTT